MRECLKLPVQHVARLNGFAREEAQAYLPKEAKKVEGLPECFVAPEFEQPEPMVESGLLPYYLMDGASVFPALALEVEGSCAFTNRESGEGEHTHSHTHTHACTHTHTHAHTHTHTHTHTHAHPFTSG